MTDLPIEGKLVPIVQGQRVADASNVEATGAGGATAQAQLETLKTDVATNTRAIQDNAGGVPDLTSLRSKVDALYPLTVDVNILTSWADIYDPAQATQIVVPIAGYSDFIDYRTSSDRFETTGIVITPGSGIVDFTNVAGDFHRCFGFEVSAPADQVLLWVVDSGTAIPLIDMTAAGNFRVNNYTPARTQDQVVTNHSNLVTAPSSGTGTISQGGSVSTYTTPAYPANTSSQTRTVEVDFDVLVSGVDSQAGGSIGFDIPDDLTAQAQATIQHNFFLGWPNNRTVSATISYEARVSGSDLLIDLNLQSAPSDITLRVDTFNVLQSYTATVVIARVDNFLTLQDESVDFTFTGEHELLVALHPVPNTDTMEVVPVVIQTSDSATTQLDDRVIPEPQPGFGSIRIPDTIEFRSFLPDHFLRHIDLVNLLRDRATKWAYGLARLEDVTEHAVTQAIDLASGSKLNGVELAVPQKTVVHQSVNTGVGAGGLVSNVTLPTDYFESDYVYAEINDSGKWITITIGTELLSQTLFGPSDNFYLDGKTELSWNVSTRSISIKGSTQQISQIALIKVS